MTRAKNNRGPKAPFYVDPGLELTQEELEKGTSGYDNWHWGYKPRKVVDWRDDDMPRMLIECGKLVRMHVRVPGEEANTHPRRRRDAMIEFSRNVSSGAHIAYDPDHPYERLYLLVPPAQRKTMKSRFWTNNRVNALPLNELAAIAGGKHGKRRDYPDVMAKPIGVLTAVVYYTAKRGDSPEQGGSFYIHEVGELSARYPFLCIDSKGRLWLAGGNYTSPSPGITD